MKTSELERPFSPLRIALLLRNRLFEEIGVIGIAFGIVFSLSLLTLVGSAGFRVDLGGQDSGASAFWGNLIFVFGIWLASRSFASMHGSGAPDWLLLPATGSEKFVAGAAWVVVLWPLLASVGSSAMSGLLSVLSFLLGRGWQPVWHPFTSATGGLALAWLSLAPVFIAGSIAFRKHSLLATVGVLAGAATATTIVMALVLYFVYSGSGGFHFDSGRIALGTDEARSGALQILFDLWRYAVLPVSALVFSWFRVREKEASDAVQ